MAALVWRLIGALYILFMISPLVLVGLFSFTDGGMANFPIHALTLKWWEAMLANPAFTSALTNSLIIGLVVSVISAVLGTMAAMGLSQLPPAVANSVMLVLSTPLMLPPLVLGVALLSFYVAAGIRLGLVTVIMSQLLFTLPFVILVIVARLRSFDFRIVESARDLGASQLTAFRTVTLPVIQPSNRCRADFARRLHRHLLHDRKRQHASDICLGNDPYIAHSHCERDRNPDSDTNAYFHDRGAAPDALSRLAAPKAL